MRRPVIVVAAALVTLVATSPGEAKKKSEGSQLGQCFLEGKIVYTQGSSTAKCCYDDGCFVCDTSWNNCKWEAAARVKVQNLAPTVRGQVLEQGTQGSTQPGLQVKPNQGTIAPSQ